jgi:hypothetical protein
MEYLITESQLKVIINEQSMGGMASPQYLAGSVNKELQQMDPHTLMSIAQIGTSFIPFVGPFISAGIGLADAKMYYSEGDKKTAGITAALSMIPFVGSLISKIPGVKQLGSKGISLLASKLSKGSKNLTKAESEIVNAVKTYSSQVQSELTKMGPKLKGVVKELEMYKGNFIKKYGQQKYNELIVKYLYDGIDKKTLLSQIKNVKNPNIMIKPVLNAGADHMVFQSVKNPNVIFKAEQRAGEVNKWYDTFVKNPKVFAKTFRKVKVKGNDGKLLDAVVMEKLDTSKFMTLWDAMSVELNKFQSKMGPSSQHSLERLVKSIKQDRGMKIKWETFIPFFKKSYPQLAPKADEFIKMVEKLYKITPNPDIRKFNLGYDKSGILKALDI